MNIRHLTKSNKEDLFKDGQYKFKDALYTGLNNEGKIVFRVHYTGEVNVFGETNSFDVKSISDNLLEVNEVG